MPQSEAIVATELPKRYLGQLCKHFQHKIPVTLEDDHGSITFEAGICRLNAADSALRMRCEAADAAALDRVQDVVARHLLRFAFREPPEIVWRPVESPLT
jgi:hypothetical protein